MQVLQANLFERFRPYRRRAEVAFWIGLLVLQVAASVAVALVDARGGGREVAFWQVLVWELSSHLVILALVPAVIAFERRFPLSGDRLWRNLPWHALGSVLFSLLHVAGMVLLRRMAYAWAGQQYDFGDWLRHWPYEYFKDVRTYVLILLLLLGYRLFLLRLQGEARVLDEPEGTPLPPEVSGLTAAPAPDGNASEERGEPPTPAVRSRPDRFLVRKLRREFLIAASDIDWVQAQGNYVGLHVNGHDYLLRATLTEFLDQLDPARHVRVHRSWAVHLDRIAEIEPLEGGDSRLHMRGGGQVPCSRRFRANLQANAQAGRGT
ncbi:LytTR family DNA-binding domain-containing protein [Variovorax dokdonensis]|uniref:LytTR family DNA-binding domain-containing protein n=1 Tax=Variovorax dokdonensis TaxID=344883 RepID=A0ABT7N7R2_9BURK|nr:LytTR family DNA-binding domain-containing protein [Variovorax dokdonensis]MDM0043972.1 LytTR family DNA-binding domain-containing protein [Variovorax dokdonensis]